MPIDDGTIADDETVTWQTLKTVYKELLRRFEEFRTAGSAQSSAISSEFVTASEHGFDSTPGHHPPETGTSTTHSHAAGGGSMTTVKEATVQVGGSDIVTLDFGAGFDITESPDTEINIEIDPNEGSLGTPTRT